MSWGKKRGGIKRDKTGTLWGGDHDEKEGGENADPGGKIQKKGA